METISIFGQTYTVAQVYDWLTAYVIPVLSGWYASNGAQWFKERFNISVDQRSRRNIIRATTFILTSLLCSFATVIVSVKTHQPITLDLLLRILLAYGGAVWKYDHLVKS